MVNVLDFRGGRDLPPREENPRPAIAITPANFEQEIDEMERHLIAAGRKLYQRDGKIVQAGTIKVKNPDGSEPSYCAPVPVEDGTLTEFSTSATSWSQCRKGQWYPCKAPRDHVRTLLQRGPRLTLPVLSGIITTPLMFADGRLLERCGYDEQSGLLFETDETFPPIPLNPTARELQEAISLFAELLPEFGFSEDAGKSVALSGFLTACCRPALETAPLHGVTAPQAGTGKSYLQDLWGLIATGQKPAFVNIINGSEGELDKRVNSLLLKGGMPRGCPVINHQ
jgi:putative DNA primase/helicase